MSCCTNSCYVHKAEHGLSVRVSGKPDTKKYNQFASDLSNVVKECGRNFNAIFDLRDAKTQLMTRNEVETFANLMAQWKNYLIGKGLNRLGVVYTTNAQIDALFRAEKTGKIEGCEERAVSTLIDVHGLETAIKWVKDGKEPN